MQNQRTIFLQKAIDSLPAKYKQVILLRHKDEMEYEEIAKALGVPIGTVKAHLFRARELLNRYMKNKIQHY
jgi:DNA-directed RNA polymerase specialized sigma subunit, sigma24 homolog